MLSSSFRESKWQMHASCMPTEGCTFETDQELSGWCVRTEMLPSEDPQASIRPSSWGLKQRLLMEAECSTEL